MFKDLFRRKTMDQLVAEAEEPEHRLKKALGPVDVTALGIGAIIGAGIFATIGTASAGVPARPGAGPGLILSFIFTAIACGYAALCYAEFAAMIPISGSAYTYAYATLGELIAWIIGWDLIIEYAVGNVAVAISWSNYFKTLISGFGITVPDWMSTDYRTAARIPGLFDRVPHLFGVPIVFNFLAFAIVALITIVLVIGIRESATMNTTMVLLKLVVLGFFVAVGWSYVKPANFHPLLPNGWAGVRAGAAIVFFAYIGFDAVSARSWRTRRYSGSSSSGSPESSSRWRAMAYSHNRSRRYTRDFARRTSPRLLPVWPLVYVRCSPASMKWWTSRISGRCSPSSSYVLEFLFCENANRVVRGSSRRRGRL